MTEPTPGPTVHRGCAVRDVYVDGVQVVRDREVTTFEIGEGIEMLRRGQRDVIAGAPGRDWAGRTLEELSPRVYPVRPAPPPA